MTTFLARPNSVVPGAPSTPTLTATVLGSTSIRLAVSATADAGFKEWSFEFATAALGPFVPLATQWAPTYDATPLSPSTTYWFRVKGVTNANQATAYSSAVSATTSAPVVAPLVLDTRFAGLSLVADGGSGSPDKYYVFSGTDSVTGQVFDGSNPRLWGGRLQFQVIGGGAFTADQMFTLSTQSGDPDLPSAGTYLQIVRNEDFAGAAQAALKFLPTDAWTAQGFALIGFRFRLPSGYPTTTNHQFTLMEVKSGGGDAPFPVVHLLATRENIGGTDKWALKLGAVRIDGANSYDTWGDDATPTVATATCTPAADAYYDGKFFSVGIGTAGVTTLDTEGWYTIIFGFRLKDHAGNVAGNGSEGWVGVWSAPPNVDGSPKNWSDCALRMFVPGRNLGYVTGPKADYVFVLNHYSNNTTAATDRAIKWADLRVDDDWWTDGPTRPAGAV